MDIVMFDANFVWKGLVVAEYNVWNLGSLLNLSA